MQDRGASLHDGSVDTPFSPGTMALVGEGRLAQLAGEVQVHISLFCN